MKRVKTAFPLLLFVLCWIPAFAQDLASFEKRVTVSKLPNGLTVVLCRRPEAPVFSFTTWVDSGSSQDPLHMTGLAHMMEHMAFKGTDKIGTTDYAAEKSALAEVERAYAAYRAERIKPGGGDAKKVAELEAAWKDAIARADKYVVKGAFDEIVQRAGGVGLNAFTTYDETVYFYSMPVNRLELWAYLESERFTHPVMREFYKERDVVMEERRMRTDSDPTERMIEQFLAVAFDANPYHRPTIGYMSDLQYFSATDAMNFFKRYYVPSNLVVAVVGDLDPATAMPIIAKYFGRIPSAAKPAEFVSTQPAQDIGTLGAGERPFAADLHRGISPPELSATPTTRFTTPSAICFPAGAPRAFTARWCATRKSRPPPAVFRLSRETSIRTCLPFMRCRCLDTRPRR